MGIRDEAPLQFLNCFSGQHANFFFFLSSLHSPGLRLFFSSSHPPSPPFLLSFCLSSFLPLSLSFSLSLLPPSFFLFSVKFVPAYLIAALLFCMLISFYRNFYFYSYFFLMMTYLVRMPIELYSRWRMKQKTMPFF